MKINKDQFKSIVKECLLEILNEGLNFQPQRSQKLEVNESAKRSRPSDLISYSKQQPAPQQNLKKIKEQVNAVAGGDPIMASIFADTAKNTLPQMLKNESSHHVVMEGADPASRMAAMSSPVELFGEEMTDKWSALAFTPSSNKIK